MTMNNEHSTLEQTFGPVISTYTRAQAIEDGILTDVGALAEEAGFIWPVALTQAAWIDCVKWTDEDSDQQIYQDQPGRLWDVLFMASYAIKNSNQSGNQLLFELYRVPRDGRSIEAQSTMLKLMVGPGDHGEPVITILLRNED